MKNSLTLPSLAKKYFYCLRDENNEPVHTYNAEFLRFSVRQSIKGGRCSTLNQYFISTISDEVINIFQKN